jgi:methylglutaconyl-CoA hydratase
MSAYQTISIADHEAIRVITLSRPERRNALTQEMIAELTHAVVAAGADDGILVLILCGAGEAFCSGLDLAELQKMVAQTAAEQRADSDKIAAMMRALYDCPKPTVAAVNGAAVAGGMGLATICDFTLAAPDARFGYPEARIGFIPAIVSAFLVRQVGEKLARDLLLTGRLIDAHEAYSMGLVSRVTEEQSALEAALELARSLLKNSPASLRATKQLLKQQNGAQLDHDLGAAAEANAEMRKTNDFAEGLSAFLEKRKPVWSVNSKD